MATEKDAANALREAGGRKSNEVPKELLDEAGRPIRSTTEQAAEALRRSVHAAADSVAAAQQEAARAGTAAAGETADAARRAARAGAERVSEGAGRLFSMSSRDAEALAGQASQSMDAMMRCSSAIADGWRTIMREMTTSSQDAFQRRMDRVSQMMRARTLPDLVDAQCQLMREEVEFAWGSGRRLSELTVEVANNAASQLAPSQSSQS
ncbi:MAG TPA: phasin family protein [Azospirillaceae bacterium]|nr:phasin family protein [Azospirillaceae bacterium]